MHFGSSETIVDNTPASYAQVGPATALNKWNTLSWALFIVAVRRRSTTDRIKKKKRTEKKKKIYESRELHPNPTEYYIKGFNLFIFGFVIDN